ncbi:MULTISPECIES: 2-polyprenyl-3-methyl-6-methoxy-1,4-benzoquinone monooxygenase [unclassified Caballeronia]|uniref:2-polyprenyl-3-methyl-6-methoxy-1,4-benzoquinone monooxygenase n=1 Tax=unclassified Caballeronia TaxID=2646786 RepID=UPI00285E39B7|nr:MULTISPECIES: 2-polyprenyl-3-methyl-6-methoxy-1,4-benzoquinone monooxygenase [unclassified Caballeronia]MDR5814543.1 2-polyprenyl-3-methyl-6-methoxy-1,4-benzoquinone monooxygenase [Caballeronia sp. LZ033]MDR5821023.1 2-polyprenyl-3-methyl-6-methoxy-1,4-benzoquinone monooxygenase [Caballeronia sp. LZ043]MDR5834898.1 2-polyprenyl-3-methyl-6-methoxy-1,4-benzoquinone monooxygenase [Caballeronia sp. LZ034LL]MDR5879178.1 2-polyprenyl-3-methyl-6-methoxy-1,4-benzoquinone monooxygenase [Caballeronia 
MTLDEVISEFDRGLRSMTGVSRMSRPLPEAAPGTSAEDDLFPEELQLTDKERAHSAGLMRVNHVGEVCAQALYQAQKLATTSPELKSSFEHAAREEEDHLAWTSQRLKDLESRPSLLNPFWYAGALALGFVAGRFGDRASLGFMAETERQVEQHLDGHMKTLPANDRASRAIVEQMRLDESAHAAAATSAGGSEMPFPVRALMRAASKVMTTTAYYI